MTTFSQKTAHKMQTRILLTINGIDVIIGDDERLTYLAGLMIDGDGSGPSHGDPCYQNDTTLHLDGKALNADVDKYIVLPPQIIRSVRGIVLGCQAQVMNAQNGQSTFAVVGDVGPVNKLGEASIATARAIGVASSPTTGGEERRVIRYSIFPGVPAIVDGKQYQLQAHR